MVVRVVVLMEGGGVRLRLLLEVLQRGSERLPRYDVVFEFLFELARSHFLIKIISGLLAVQPVRGHGYPSRAQVFPWGASLCARPSPC